MDVYTNCYYNIRKINQKTNYVPLHIHVFQVLPFISADKPKLSNSWTVLRQREDSETAVWFATYVF
jgi:hypothetical protein